MIGGYEAGFMWEISYDDRREICPETRQNVPPQQTQISNVIIIAAASPNVSNTVVVESSILTAKLTLKEEEHINPIVFSVPLKRLKNKGKRMGQTEFSKLID